MDAQTWLLEISGGARRPQVTGAGGGGRRSRGAGAGTAHALEAATEMAL